MAFRRKKDSEMGSFQKRTAWTAEEDALLTQQVAIYGTHCWPEVASAMVGRTSKACSLRWRCFLSPHIIRPNDEPFSQWEVAVIVLTQRVFGNKWNDIASYLPMRCNNDIKNYFNLYLKDKEQQVYSDNFFLRSGYELSHLLNDEPADVAERRKKLDEEKGPAASDAAKLSRPLTATVRKPATPVAGKARKAGTSAGGVAGVKGGVVKGAAKRVATSAAALSAAMSEDYAAYYSSSDGSYVAAAAAAAYGSPGQVVGSYYCGEGDVMAAYAGGSAALYTGSLDAAGAAAAAGVPGVYAGSFTAGSMTDAAAAAAASAGVAPGYNTSGGYGGFSLASGGGSGLHVAHNAAQQQQQQQQQHLPAEGQHDALMAAAPLSVPAGNGYGSSSLFLQQQEAALNAYGATCFTTATPASTHEAPGNGAAGACDAGSKGNAGGAVGGAAVMGLLRPLDDAAGSPLLCPGSIGNRVHFLPEGLAALSADPIAAARHTFWKPLTDDISPGDASLLLEDDPTHDDVIAEFAAYEDADEPTASLGGQQRAPGGSLGSRPGSTASASSGALHAAAAGAGGPGAEAKSPESAASLQTAGGGGAAGATSSDACCNMQQDSPISAAAVAAALAVARPHQQPQQLHKAMQVESKASQAGAAAAGGSLVPASPASPPQPLAPAFDSYHSPAPTAGSARKCTNLRLGLLNPALSHVVGGGDRNALSAPCTVTAAYTPNGSWQQSTLPAGAFTQGVGSQQHEEAGWAHHKHQQQVAGMQPSQMHTPFTNLHHQQQQLQEMCIQYHPWGLLHQQHQHMAAAEHHYAARAYASSHSSHQQAMHLPLEQQQVPSPSSATATAIASGGFNSPSCLATPNSWTSCSRQAQSALRPSAAATVGAEHSSRAASWARHGTRGAAASDDSEEREADGQLWGIKAECSALGDAGHARTEPTHHSVGGAAASHAGIRLSDDDGCLGRVWDSFDGSHLHDTMPGDDHAVKLVHNAVRWGSTSLGRLSVGW